MSKVIRCKYRDEEGRIYKEDIPIEEETTKITEKEISRLIRCRTSLLFAKNSLVDVILPEGIRGIDEKSFDGFFNLENIEIPEGVTKIGEYAFFNCRSLECIKIPYGITEISNYTFSFCKSLKHIEIPESVTKIGKYAFYGCRSLECVKISEKISYYANSFDEHTKVIIL